MNRSADLAGFAKEKREKSKLLSFDEFEATVYKEPFENGKYIVNGDTPIIDKEALKEFFSRNIQNSINPSASMIQGLVVHQVNNQDAKWNDSDKKQLNYCVSTTFGGNYQDVVSKMQSATYMVRPVLQDKIRS